MKATLRTTALVASVLLVGSALAACGSSSGADESEEEQTLRLSLAAPPGNFQIGNWSGADATPFLNVYDTILKKDIDGSVQPGLAEAWEYAEGNTVLTLTIREGQSFSDGSPVDAEAVAASLEAARAGASTSQNLVSVAEVEASDDATVVVTLTEPDAALIPSFATIVGAVGAPSVLTDESSKLNPIGSGPYVLNESQTKPGTVYVFDRNNDYWDVEAFPFEHVEMPVIVDNTAQVNAMKAGQIDWLRLSAETVPQFENDPSFTVGQEQPNAFGTIWLVDKNGSIVPALADPRVRQAISMAIDRTAVVEKLLGGQGAVSNQIFNPAGEAFDESLLDLTPYDPEAARALLAEAGYADGFTMAMPSTPLSTSFEPVISQSLQEIGITVEWESIQLQDLYPKVLGGDYGAYFSFNSFSGSDALDFTASMAGSRNPQLSTTPELEGLVDAMNSAPESEQPAAIKKINDYLVEHAWSTSLLVLQSKYATSEDVVFTPPVALQIGVRPFAPAD